MVGHRAARTSETSPSGTARSSKRSCGKIDNTMMVRATDATTDERARSIRISSAAYSHLVEVARQLDTGISFTANLLIAEGTVRTVGATAAGDSRSIRISPAAYHHLVGISRKLSLSISRAAHLLITSGTKETIEEALLARGRRRSVIGPERAAETAKRLIRTNADLFRRLS